MIINNVRCRPSIEHHKATIISHKHVFAIKVGRSPNTLNDLGNESTLPDSVSKVPFKVDSLGKVQSKFIAVVI